MNKQLVRVKYTKWYNISKLGVLYNNQVAIAVLGICSSLAITNKVENAIAMGLGVTFVTMSSSAVVGLLRNYIPPKVRMVAYMVIISTFTIAVQMFLAAYFPAINKQLGPYLGLIITNCIVMGRAEAFAAKNPARYALVDGLASGLGYMSVLLVASFIRELLAFGTLLNYRVLPEAFPTWSVMALAPGGFFVISMLIWGIRETTKNFEPVKGE